MLENKIKVKKFDIISLFLILIFFGIDRISKIGVIKKIQAEQGDIFLNDFINITLNWNQGIAFGLFSLDTSFLYHLISAIILIIIVSVAIFGLLVFVFVKNLSPTLKLCLGLCLLLTLFAKSTIMKVAEVYITTLFDM